ncbi:hypothetical protein [Enhygromyxa salina]|nr:hypothetical protein [Enhygromyxa salina]
MGAGVLVLLLAGSGCSRSDSIDLAAIRGCGLDQEFSGLRVRVLGDFPASGGSELLLGPGEQGSIPELPAGATGVAAEGLFGTTTTAIGRSWGVDAELGRGRLPGFDDAPVLSVFFAAPDSLCEVDTQPSARAESAAAAHPSGDVLVVGGLDGGGALLDEVFHVDLLTGEGRALAARLPQPRRGHSVHAIDGRRFVILGGAGPNAVAQDRVIVDVAGPGSVTVVDPLEVDGDALVSSDHATASSPNSARQVLVAGGCDVVDPQARCDPASALAATHWIDPAQPSATVQLPPLTQPRFGAHAAVSPDGVAWVAGGVGSDGDRLGSVERMRPGEAWTIVHELPEPGSVRGLALLDDGLVLLSDDAGLIHWWSEAGSGTLDPTSRAPPLALVSSERPMLALPGERVLVDTWLFTPGTAAVDPASGRVELPPIPRYGGQLLSLHDGTALIVGGWITGTQELAAAPLLRLRPRLDGPDEWTPELAGPQNDAFVSNAPGRATVIVGGLRLNAIAGESDALPLVRAHVRGFRSRTLRLEFSFEAEPGSTAHVILGQGSETLVAIALQDPLVVRRRGPDGSTGTLDCGPPASAAVIGPLVLELGADGHQLRLESEAGTLATCELQWPSSAGVSVGFGASGAEGARFFGLRLARR